MGEYAVFTPLIFLTGVLFGVLYLLKCAFAEKMPRTHDVIFCSIKAREERDKHLQRWYSVDGVWKGNGQSGYLVVHATTPERALIVANRECRGEGYGCFESAKATLRTDLANPYGHAHE